MPFCIHCGAEIFWSFPRPEDECFNCGKPVCIPDSLEEKNIYLDTLEEGGDNEALRH